MNKQLQEEIVYNFLSSCFGVDIKESFENISENDIKGAIQYINLLTYALNEQWRSTTPLPSSSGPTIDRTRDSQREKEMLALTQDNDDFSVNMGDVTRDLLQGLSNKKERKEARREAREARKVEKGNEVIQDFLQNPDQYATPDTTPPHQDFIRGTYKSLEQDGLVPYQGPGGEVQVTNNTGFKSDSVSATLNRIATGAKNRFKAPEKETPKTSTSSSGAYDITEPPLMAPEGSDAIPGELNQRLVTHALNAADGKDTRNFTPGSPFIDYEKITATKAREAQDAEFKENLPWIIKAKMALYDAESKAATDKLIAGQGTVEGERRMDDVLSKPAHSAKAEAARQSVIASRARRAEQDREAGHTTALSDPDAFTMYSKTVTPSGKTDSGEAAFTLDDRMKYHVQQRMKELGGGRSATKSGSNLYVEQYTGSSSGPTGRVNVVDVRAERETGRRMANAGYPGSSVGPPRRPASQQETIPWIQGLMDEIVARSNTEEAIADRDRRTARLDAASRARDEYAASERGQAEINSRVEAENASRDQRGLPPLNPSAERSFRRSAAAAGGRRDQYTAARDERMGLPPVGTPQQPQPEPVTGQATRQPTPDPPGDSFGQRDVSTPEDRPQTAGTGNTTSVGGGFNIPGQAPTHSPRPFENPGYYSGELDYEDEDPFNAIGRTPRGWDYDGNQVTAQRTRIKRYNEDPNRGKFGASGNTPPSWISTPVASVLNSRGSVITPTTYRRPGSAGFGVTNTSVGNNIGFA